MTRAQKAVRLLTQIREKDPALFQQIQEFQFRHAPEVLEKWGVINAAASASEQEKFLQSIRERRTEPN